MQDGDKMGYLWKQGFFAGPIPCSRAIAPKLSLDGNRSSSFRALLSGLGRLLDLQPQR